MKMSEKMIVPHQQKEENFLMKVSRPPTSNKRPTTNHLQKSPNRGHANINEMYKLYFCLYTIYL